GYDVHEAEERLRDAENAIAENEHERALKYIEESMKFITEAMQRPVPQITLTPAQPQRRIEITPPEKTTEKQVEDIITVERKAPRILLKKDEYEKKHEYPQIQPTPPKQTMPKVHKKYQCPGCAKLFAVETQIRPTTVHCPWCKLMVIIKE
ncbi:MAG: hypothetical protein QXT63_02250, partial [Thermoplasmata archaeon]